MTHSILVEIAERAGMVDLNAGESSKSISKTVKPEAWSLKPEAWSPWAFRYRRLRHLCFVRNTSLFGCRLSGQHLKARTWSESQNLKANSVSANCPHCSSSPTSIIIARNPWHADELHSVLAVEERSLRWRTWRTAYLAVPRKVRHRWVQGTTWTSDHRLLCMYSGIYGLRSVFSMVCPSLLASVMMSSDDD